MKVSTIVTGLFLVASSGAWELDFYAGDKYLKTHGDNDVSSCVNLASSYDKKTTKIVFDPATDWQRDPQTFTAYPKTGCGGDGYTGRGGTHKINPSKRFKSYSINY